MLVLFLKNFSTAWLQCSSLALGMSIEVASLHRHIGRHFLIQFRCYQHNLLQVFRGVKSAVLLPVLHNGIGNVPADVGMLF